MKLFFLGASRPLTKSFDMKGDTLIKHSYPHVKNFSSSTEDVGSISEFYKALKSHAEKHECLLKGHLTRSLVSEPRAGTTVATTMTEWLVLDLDGIKGMGTVSDFIQILPREFHNIDYIVQYSSSMGVDPDKGLSAHIFFILDRPVQPSIVKEWFKHINLTTESLRGSFSLASSGVVFKWPVDISVAQNDKLIYIAPPILGDGVEDSWGEPRIQLVKRGNTTLSPDFTSVNAEMNRTKGLKLINAMRKEIGLEPKRDLKLKKIRDAHVAMNPDKCIVTGIKEDRGFTYFNLNSGDSWGYFHPEENADIIYNFKGEPDYMTKDLIPEYWAGLPENKAKTPEQAQKGREVKYLLVSDKASSVYHRCTYKTNPEHLTTHATRSIRIAEDFLLQHGIEPGEFIPEYDVRFNFSDKRTFDEKQKFMNLYHPSDPMLNTEGDGHFPHVINKIIHSALGSDPVVVEHFINWVACILQYRQKLGTAWVLQGTQGTGKGLLFHKILTPLIGADHAAHTELGSFGGSFNALMESSIFMMVDEISAQDMRANKGILAKLKSRITETRITINKKGVSEYLAENWTHFIFASNEHESVTVPSNDRRINVAPRQEKSLTITSSEVDSVAEELQAFADYLMNYEADLVRGRTVLENQARADLQQLSKTGTITTLEALHAGDIEFLYDNRPDENEEISGVLNMTGTQIMPYTEAVQEYWNNEGSVSRDALWSIIYYITGKQFKTAHNFSITMGKHGAQSTKVRIIERGPVRGFEFGKPIAEGKTLQWITSQKADLTVVPHKAR